MTPSNLTKLLTLFLLGTPLFFQVSATIWFQTEWLSETEMRFWGEQDGEQFCWIELGYDRYPCQDTWGIPH